MMSVHRLLVRMITVFLKSMSAAFAVGEHALVEHLVEQVHHLGVGLLALVEQHDRVRPLAHRLGEHAALAVARRSRAASR